MFNSTRLGGLLVILLGAASPALAQSTSPWAQPSNQVSGGFGATRSSTGTTGATTGATTGTSTTSAVSADDLLMTEFAEVIALADALATELQLEFQNPWEELYFVLIVADLRARLLNEQARSSGFGRRGGAVGGSFGGAFGGGRSQRAPGGFGTQTSTGSGGTTTTGTSTRTP